MACRPGSLRDAQRAFIVGLPLVGVKIHPATNGSYMPKAITRHEVAAIRAGRPRGSALGWHGALVQDHPVCAEAVAQHGEPVGEEGLLNGHEDLSAFRENVVDALSLFG
jgi:hypothetical protein